MRRVLVALAVAAVAGALVTPSAAAATKTAHGWWWRPQTGVLGTAIPPPGVPDDGLAVETLPDGPTAVAAVRYVLEPGESQPVLVLKVAEQQGEVAIQACAATQHWSQDHGGPWDERPTYDCGGAAEGTTSKDGATWQWSLSTLVRKQRLDVVLVPAPGSGRVTFEPPDDKSVQTTSSTGSGGQNFDPPPVSAFTDPGQGSAGGSSGSFSPPQSSGTPFSGGTSGGAASGGSPPADLAAPSIGPEPEPPAAAGPLPAQSDPAPAATAPASSDTSRTIGAIIAAMATVLALGLWHQESAIPRRAGALDKAGVATPPQSYGGLGRFARARTGSPRPLL